MSLPSHTRCIILVGPERLELAEIPIAPPGEGEIVVRIDAATTCGTDVKVFLRGGHPRMIVAPSPFGHEMTGTIAACGPGVSEWREGDAVIVANSASCGSCRACREGRENLCSDLLFLNGAYGEYLPVPRRFVERSLYARPATLDPAIAAMTEPLACVVHGLDLCDLRQSRDVVVIGGGPMGLLFTALLTSGGHRVTLADPNPSRLALAAALGAVATIAVRHGANASVASSALSKEGFDLAIDATGSTAGWDEADASIRPGGTALLFGGCAPGTTITVDTHRMHYSELSLKGCFHHRPATFARAIELLTTEMQGVRLLLSGETGLEDVENALRSMIRREATKIVVRPGASL